MTKKDYELIAGVIASLALEREDTTCNHDAGFECGREAVAGLLASKLKVDNPRFDRDRFLTACKV